MSSRLPAGKITDIEIFGISVKSVIKYSVILGSAYFALSLVTSVIGIALIPVKIISWVVMLPFSLALGGLWGAVKTVFSLAAIGGLAYGAWKFFKG